MGLNGSLVQKSFNEFRELKLIPLVVRYSGGTPSIVQNPLNEDISLTDTGTGDLRLTLASASVAPLFAFIEVLPTAAGTLGLLANLKAAPSRTVVDILVNSGADGATETDPVDLHILLVKTVEAAAA